MNELQNRFEETGKLHFITREENGDLIRYFNPEYVRWLESQLTWRSVEDGLPSRGKFMPVLLSGNIGQLYALHYMQEGNVWGDGKGTTYNNVTHWLPIPFLD